MARKVLMFHLATLMRLAIVMWLLSGTILPDRKKMRGIWVTNVCLGFILYICWDQLQYNPPFASSTQEETHSKLDVGTKKHTN